MRNSKLNKFFRNFTFTGGIIGLMAGSVFSVVSFYIFSVQIGSILTSSFLVFSFLFYYTFYRPMLKRENILINGEAAQAEIISVRKTAYQARISGKTGLPVYEFTVKVFPDNENEFVTTMKDSVITDLMGAYRNKIRLTVRFDPKKKEKIIVEKADMKIINDKYTIWGQT